MATLSQQFAAFATRRQFPFLCVHSGPRTRITGRPSFTEVEIKRGPAAFPVDHDLSCDPFLSRYKNWVTAQVRPFDPHLIHITGPGDVGILGLWVAHTLRVPLVASWHTNLHEYAGRRLNKLFSFLPDTWRDRVCLTAEEQSLRACLRFYGLARFLLAPNEAMVHLLQERTGKPAFPMAHGVDTEAYSPQRRCRQDRSFCIGYVGRLTPEKNVRLFVDLERSLLAQGQRNFRFTLIGEGSERGWLGKNLEFGETPGILRGKALAEAFANMDVFVFPSRTDTFGLVLLEAMASGVPVVVSPETGFRVGIRHGVTGFHAQDLHSFTESVRQLMHSETLRQRMGAAARVFTCSNVWNGAFEQLYRTYEWGLEATGCQTRDRATAESRTTS
ncbi:MAG TPA: glycosyltransferase [Candidatus Solibacter sp.]|nr:glycosyltransferase [Candidatus Solibacter sp.]